MGSLKLLALSSTSSQRYHPCITNNKLRLRLKHTVKIFLSSSLSPSSRSAISLLPLVFQEHSDVSTLDVLVGSLGQQKMAFMFKGRGALPRHWHNRPLTTNLIKANCKWKSSVFSADIQEWYLADLNTYKLLTGTGHGVFYKLIPN
ncbi:hypothetical protein A0H81_11637 [Grifola frondosa]|uniref:Uncharacterized protein n=1 Tax=Grifola frondosa TaxID=5627 RepID=A0A1C7LUS6_GRIFR|nr:hypothetical protein A0H81_11637 [Grifola frondosa]